MDKQFEATVTLATPRTMTEPADCLAALRRVCEYPSLQPEFFGLFEPVNHPLDCRRLESVIETVWKWQDGPDDFLWQRSEPAFQGGIHMMKDGQAAHASVDLVGTAGSSAVNQQLVDFLKRVSVALGVDLGLIEPTPLHPDGSPSGLTITTWTLQQGLPNLYWGTILGRPYIHLFGGAVRVASTPVAICQQLAPELFYLQLTKDLNDVRDRPKAVDAARQSAKEYLGIDAFADGYLPDFRPRVPDFVFRP